MTSQRKTGIVCSSLTLLVIIQYVSKGQIDSFTMFCVAVFIPCLLSVFWESETMKAFLMITLFSIGGVLQFEGDASAYIGICIISITAFHCFSYGYLEKNPTVKTAVAGSAMFFLVGVSSDANLVAMIMRVALTVAIILMIWIPAHKLANEAKKAAELRGDRLEKTLNETIIAGVVLVEEIKHKESEHESKG